MMSNPSYVNKWKQCYRKSPVILALPLGEPVSRTKECPDDLLSRQPDRDKWEGEDSHLDHHQQDHQGWLADQQAQGLAALQTPVSDATRLGGLVQPAKIITLQTALSPEISL